jgi:hypothetical protein
MYLTEFR